MFVCPLFREFREPNKTTKLKGTNINCRPKIGRNYYSISNYIVLICQNRGAIIILHAKLPTFRAAKLKGFTVFDRNRVDVMECAKGVKSLCWLVEVIGDEVE